MKACCQRPFIMALRAWCVCTHAYATQEQMYRLACHLLPATLLIVAVEQIVPALHYYNAVAIVLLLILLRDTHTARRARLP